VLDNRQRGILWAVASAFSVAGFVIPWKLANSGGDAHLNTLVLLASAALFNTVLSASQSRSLPRFRAFDVGFAAVLGLLSLLGNLFSARGVELLSPALLIVVMRSEVFIVALMAWPLIGERVERRYWLGAGLAVAGLALMQDPMAGVLHASGIVWAILATTCFSAMAVFTRKVVDRLDIVAVNGLRLWMAVAMWFALNGAPPELMEMELSSVGYSALAAFFGPFIGRLCLMQSARYVEARVTALANLGSPVITLVLAWAVLDDLPTGHELLGGLVMLVGIAFPIVAWARRYSSNTNPS
jgi:drug/metabolite transporter (DMT)-like permease